MLKQLCTAISLLFIQFGVWAQEDIPQAGKPLRATLLAEVTTLGQKVTALALEYEDNVLASTDLRSAYQVSTQLEEKESSPV